MFIFVETEGERHLWMFPPECLSIPQISLNGPEITTAFKKKGPSDCFSVWETCQGHSRQHLALNSHWERMLPVNVRKCFNIELQSVRTRVEASHYDFIIPFAWCFCLSVCLRQCRQAQSASSSASKAVSLVYNSNSGQTSCQESNLRSDPGRGGH